MLKKDNFGPAKLYEFSEIGGESAQISRESSGDSHESSPKHSVFGIIAPHSDDFCASCNRIRLTSEGIICPCLYFEDAIDASSAIKNGDKEAMTKALLKAIENKPEKNKWGENENSTRAFYQTGG